MLWVREGSAEKIMCILYHEEYEDRGQSAVSMLSEHIRDISVYKADKHLSLFIACKHRHHNCVY